MGPTDRLLGSVQFVNVARQTLILFRDEERPGVRVLAAGPKTNLNGCGVFAFRIEALNDDEIHRIRESDELDHLSPADQKKLLDGLCTVRWEVAPEELDVDKFIANTNAEVSDISDHADHSDYVARIPSIDGGVDAGAF